MDSFPELNNYLGKPLNSSTRVLWIMIFIILITVAVIAFLLATGYVNVSSPTNKTL